MKDNDVIKALECCNKDGSCADECPYYTREFIGNCLDTKEGIMAKALDLINRQKTEIDILIRKKETLKDELAEKQAESERLKYLLREEENKNVILAKRFYKEGAKDFAEKLKETYNFATSEDIDNLLAEMESERE